MSNCCEKRFSHLHRHHNRHRRLYSRWVCPARSIKSETQAQPTQKKRKAYIALSFHNWNHHPPNTIIMSVVNVRRVSLPPYSSFSAIVSHIFCFSAWFHPFFCFWYPVISARGTGSWQLATDRWRHVNTCNDADSIFPAQDVTDPFYRYKMDRLQAKIEGKGNGIKTVIVNLNTVAQALGRPPACELYISFPCSF